MSNRFEAALAVWCGLLVGIALGLIGTLVGWHQGTLPTWTDAFYSSWAQMIGSMIAIGVAISIGRSQVRSDARLRQQELDDERLLAAHLAYQALHTALATMNAMVRETRIEDMPALHAATMNQIQESSSVFREVLRKRIQFEHRGWIMSAMAAVDRFLYLERLLNRPLGAADYESLKAQITVAETAEKWLRTHLARIEPERIDPRSAAADSPW